MLQVRGYTWVSGISHILLELECPFPSTCSAQIDRSYFCIESYPLKGSSMFIQCDFEGNVVLANEQTNVLQGKESGATI